MPKKRSAGCAETQIKSADLDGRWEDLKRVSLPGAHLLAGEGGLLRCWSVVGLCMDAMFVPGRVLSQHSTMPETFVVSCQEQNRHYL